jgi:putative membrane protein
MEIAAMNRRLLLTSLAALAASPALAQTNAQPASGTPATLSAARQKHIQDTMAVGSLSLMLSRIALPKINIARLKQFAEFEIGEQETIADILKNIQTNAPPAGAIKAPTDAELMQALDPAGKAVVERLRGMRPGSALDRDYIREEVDGHRKLLDIQETYLKAPDDLDETNVAKLARGMIKEHLALLGDIERLG